MVRHGRQKLARIVEVVWVKGCIWQRLFLFSLPLEPPSAEQRIGPAATVSSCLDPSAILCRHTAAQSVRSLGLNFVGKAVEAL